MERLEQLQQPAPDDPGADQPDRAAGQLVGLDDALLPRRGVERRSALDDVAELARPRCAARSIVIASAHSATPYDEPFVVSTVRTPRSQAASTSIRLANRSPSSSPHELQVRAGVEDLGRDPRGADADHDGIAVADRGDQAGVLLGVGRWRHGVVGRPVEEPRNSKSANATRRSIWASAATASRMAWLEARTTWVAGRSRWRSFGQTAIAGEPSTRSDTLRGRYLKGVWSSSGVVQLDADPGRLGGEDVAALAPEHRLEDRVGRRRRLVQLEVFLGDEVRDGPRRDGSTPRSAVGPGSCATRGAEWYDSASAAILRQPVSPPAMPRSGRTYCGPPASSRSRNSQTVPHPLAVGDRQHQSAWRSAPGGIIESIWIGSS